MKAEDLMTREVVTAGPEMPLEEAIGLMFEHRVSGLPVVGNDGLLVGLLTERNLLHRAETGTDGHWLNWLEAIVAPGQIAERYVRTHGHRVGDVMTRDFPSVPGSCPLDKIVQLMEAKNVRRVPIVEDGRLVGIISRSDLVRALGLKLRRAAEGSKRDDEIRDSIVRELSRNKWIECRAVDVSVAGGVAEFRGEITDGRMRDALRVMVEALPGVRAVRDHLTLVDPNMVLIYGV
jgi:CBS domain-containing protein